MLIIEMLKGLPASGKSTYAKEKVRKKKNSVKRVNKDDLREMIDGGEWSKGSEKIILQIRDNMIRNFIRNGKHVIVDDTNLHPKHEKNLSDIAKELGCRFIVNDSFMSVSPEECVIRDSKRLNPVGKDAIMSQYKNFILPKTFRSEEYRYKHQDKSLPTCMIVDLDGTLFYIDDSVEGSRSPYDMTRVDEDRVNLPVYHLINSLVSNEFYPIDKVFFVSGRSSDGRIKSTRYIKELFGSSGEAFQWKLLMRNKCDSRKDVIVKKEIFESHIAGNYWVRWVLDDRQQTVDGFRELGLPTLQVAKGDF